MLDVTSKEYQLVISLFDSGKISETERDELIAALAEEEEFEKSVVDTDLDTEKPQDGAADETPCYAITIVFSVDGEFAEQKLRDVCANVNGVANVRTDVEAKTVTVAGDFDNSAVMCALDRAGFDAQPLVIDMEENGRKVHIDFFGNTMHVDINNKPVGEYIKDAFGKVASFIGKGVKSVGNASGKIVRAAGDMVHAVGDFFTDLSGSGSSNGEKRSAVAENYVVPYEEMTASVKYTNGGSVFRCAEPITALAKLKAKCVSAMSERAYSELYDKLEERFVGLFKYVCGDETLKLTVRPE